MLGVCSYVVLHLLGAPHAHYDAGDGGVAEGKLDPADIDEQALAQHLLTAPWPDPDLLIRTSGELRISNFLLWQLAYSEIWVTPVLWPDFTRTDLFQAILDFQRRNRRFGKVLA